MKCVPAREEEERMTGQFLPQQPRAPETGVTSSPLGEAGQGAAQALTLVSSSLGPAQSPVPPALEPRPGGVALGGAGGQVSSAAEGSYLESGGIQEWGAANGRWR